MLLSKKGRARRQRRLFNRSGWSTPVPMLYESACMLFFRHLYSQHFRWASGINTLVSLGIALQMIYAPKTPNFP